MLVIVVGAGAFAAGRALPAAPVPVRADSPQLAAMPAATEEGEDELPPGHPPIDSLQQASVAADRPPAEGADETPLQWTAPSRWQSVANTNSMRLATYRIPRASGDTADAELSITRAGGSADANADRWVGQFDADARKSARRSVRRVGSLDVVIVEVQGTYSGGMGKEGSQPGWALLGAIVPTPGMPYFFKLTGPGKSVVAARAEFEAMVGSLVQRWEQP
jgi:hypothetical protein